LTDSLFPLRRLTDVGVRLHDCEHKTPIGRPEGFPYIAIPDIQDGRIKLSTVRRISASELEEWTRRTAPRSGDVIMTRRGRVGDTAVVPDGLTCAIGQNLVILRSDGSKVAQSYLRWALRGPLHRLQVEKFINMGAVFNSLNCADIPRFEIPVPEMSEQRAIAEVLSGLDDKIESNDRALAAIGGLVAAEVAVERHRAELSGGLHSVPLGELVDKVGVVARPASITDEDRYIGLEHLPRGSMFLDTWMSAGSPASHKTRFLQSDLLFGKLRPYFRKAGIAPVDGVCSTDILVLRARHPSLRGVALVELTSDALFDYASSGSAGTRMPRVSWEYLSKWVVALPSDGRLSKLSAITTPLIEMGCQLCRETPVLASLRDTLLPELLSGRLRVREAEELVESVT
jgi:type I restriction enzyme S subunit